MDKKKPSFHETSFPAAHDGLDVRANDYENDPLSRTEYIQALVHLYRGELQRALEWRTRLDTTTNWAIISTVGILTFSFSNPQFAQETLITGMYANLMFLFHESRRFRFFDVWRSRVRMIEENFYGPILRRDPHSPISNWGEHVAQDLLHPKFKITRLQAMKARLRRNYGYIFIFLFMSWLGRALVFPEPVPTDYPSIFAVGKLHWLVPLVLVSALYTFLICLMIFTPRVTPAEESYWPDPEHLGEEVPSLDV